MEPALAERATECIQGQIPARADPAVLEKVEVLLPAAKSERSQLHRRKYTEAIVQHSGTDVGGSEAGLAPQPAGQPRIVLLGRTQTGHHERPSLSEAALHTGRDIRRGIREMPRSL